MSLIPLPWRILTLLALAAALFGTGWIKGLQHAEAAHDLELSRQRDAAERKTTALYSDALTLEQVKNDQIHTIDARLAAALGELRQRPERLVPHAAAACAGTTGAELSRPDAAFLAGEAARADRLRAALGECQARYQLAVDSLKALK